MIAALASSPALSVTPAVSWKDSYSVGNQCYCVTTYDHGAGTIMVDTPAGAKSVEEICETIGAGPGVGSNPVYNDVQCGNGPANDAIDEVLCPGRVDLGKNGCAVTGPTWNLDQFFTPLEVATTGDTTPDNTDGTTGGLAPDETNGSITGGTTGTTTDDTTEQVEETELPPAGILFEAETAVTADSRWFTITADTAQQDTSSDPDINHSFNASNTSYLELLPDTLALASDAVTDDNQWNEPGFGPILQYEIDVPEAGVYGIAVRGYATGDYDRRIHAGVDGLWTTSSNNITLCETNRWSWSNCNDIIKTVEFDSAGIHQLMFSAAEDGFELDQFVLTRIQAEANSTEAEPELAEAISVGEGVAFGAAVAHDFLFFAGLILLLRRRTAQQ